MSDRRLGDDPGGDDAEVLRTLAGPLPALRSCPPSLRDEWDRRHRAAEVLPAPAAVLCEHQHLLPAGGRALDLACGLGANAALLARRGFEVAAWDLSPVAVARVRDLASRMQLPIAAEVRDVCARPPHPATFDCILVAHFLDRSLAPALAAALRPGGFLFYQTFARDGGCGPKNPCYRLDTNELLHLFSGLTLRFYLEEGQVGDLSKGARGLVQFIGQQSMEQAK